MSSQLSLIAELQKETKTNTKDITDLRSRFQLLEKDVTYIQKAMK
jgi:uncharacterized protein YeeX (DUF496 family)